MRLRYTTRPSGCWTDDCGNAICGFSLVSRAGVGGAQCLTLRSIHCFSAPAHWHLCGVGAPDQGLVLPSIPSMRCRGSMGGGTRGVRPQSRVWGGNVARPQDRRHSSLFPHTRHTATSHLSPGPPHFGTGGARYVGHGWGRGARQWSGPPDQQTTPAAA